MVKHFIVHASFHNNYSAIADPKFREKVRIASETIDDVLANGRRVVTLTKESPNLEDMDADVYIIPGDVSAKNAAAFIKDGDHVVVYGRETGICVNKIYEDALYCERHTGSTTSKEKVSRSLH